MLAPSFHISDKLSAHHRTLSTEQIDMLGQKLTQLEKENKSLEEELQQMHAEKKNLENQLSVYEVRVSTNNLSSEKKLKDKDTMILATSE
jgi:predicted RNase H-like nuclease (RuvC/YqgF family)